MGIKANFFAITSISLLAGCYRPQTMNECLRDFSGTAQENCINNNLRLHEKLERRDYPSGYSPLIPDALQ